MVSNAWSCPKHKHLFGQSLEQESFFFTNRASRLAVHSRIYYLSSTLKNSWLKGIVHTPLTHPHIFRYVCCFFLATSLERKLRNPGVHVPQHTKQQHILNSYFSATGPLLMKHSRNPQVQQKARQQKLTCVTVSLKGMHLCN